MTRILFFGVLTSYVWSQRRSPLSRRLIASTAAIERGIQWFTGLSVQGRRQPHLDLRLRLRPLCGLLVGTARLVYQDQLRRRPLKLETASRGSSGSGRLRRTGCIGLSATLCLRRGASANNCRQSQCLKMLHDVLRPIHSTKRVSKHRAARHTSAYRRVCALSLNLRHVTHRGCAFRNPT